MGSQFHRRLVGTIILVAIGIIFLPDFFDGKKQHYQEQFASIPLEPEMTMAKEVETILAPEEVEVALPADPVSVVIEEPKKPEQPVKVAKVPVTEPKLTNKDSGWMIQLGVFRNMDNAFQLQERLRKAGYQAHVFPKKPKKGDLMRVVVGPDVSKSKLSAQLGDLQKLTGLEGQLLRFNPLNP